MENQEPMKPTKKMQPKSLELLGNVLREWCLLSGHRELSEPELQAWMNLFGHVHPKVLVMALQKVTLNMQYMPKPGHLSQAIEAAKSELCWKEKGLLVSREGTDANGTPCVYWSDQPEVPAYRAVDCPEGRAFLAQLAKMSGRTPEQMVHLWEKWTSNAGDLR